MAEGSSPPCLQVALEGSVIWISPDHDQFILQDDTGGVRLTADSARNLRLGCRATVKGGCFLYAKGIYTQPLLEDDGIHAPVEKSARIRLLAGSYPLKIEFFNALGPFELKIDIAAPASPASLFRRKCFFILTQPPPDPPACDYYEGAWQTLPDFSALRPLRRGVVARPSLDLRARDTNFGVVFAGFLKTREAGEYTFWLSSDDGSRLLLGAPLKITMLDTAPFPPSAPVAAGSPARESHHLPLGRGRRNRRPRLRGHPWRRLRTGRWQQPDPRAGAGRHARRHARLAAPLRPCLRRGRKHPHTGRLARVVDPDFQPPPTCASPPPTPRPGASFRHPRPLESCQTYPPPPPRSPRPSRSNG